MKRHHLIFSILFILSPLIIFADNYVIINQVMYDSPLNESITESPYSNGEFIELYNGSNDTVSLQGWYVTGGSATEKYYFSNQSILPKGFLAIAFRHPSTPSFVLEDMSYPSAGGGSQYTIIYQNNIILSNGSESITLYNANNEIVDQICYGGTSNVSTLDRLSANNLDNIPGNQCVSLFRTWVEFDEDGLVVPGISKWKTDYISLTACKLAETSFGEHNLMGSQPMPTDENYIISVSPLDQATRVSITDNGVSVSNGVRTHTAIQYYDGLGRPFENVTIETTPGRNDLVQVTDYKGLHVASKQWLPIPAETEGQLVNVSNVKTEAQSFYSDNRPFSETLYENSSLERVTGHKRQGESWNDHPTSNTYDINYTNDINIYKITRDSVLWQTGSTYAFGTLYKTTTSDEDGKSVITYTDKLGQKVMEERAGNYTYYVYDDLGRLRYVLPQIPQNKLPCGEYAPSTAVLRAAAYYYQYDSIGNMIYKRLPGCEPQYMVYDRLGQLVLKQDGNQRAENKWTLCAYDSIGRNLYTAEIKLAQTHDYYISFFADKWQVEHYGNNPSHLSIAGTGYASTLLGKNNLHLLTLNYYDNYDYLSKLSTPMRQAIRFVQESGYGLQHSSATGLLTGTRVYSLSEDGYTATAYYYDAQGRIVQSRSARSTDIYKTVTSTEYLFDGSVAQQLTEQGTNGDLVREHYRYTYDHAGRTKDTYYQLNNGAEVILSSLSYDSIGHLAQNLLHNKRDTLMYFYDMRNLLTNIWNKHFSEELFYGDLTVLADFAPHAQACYNGNIAAARISQKDTAFTFDYTYDALNRLTESVQEGNGQTTPSEWFQYDSRGNITRLQRYSGPRLLDDLTFDYQSDGNQLLSVWDAGLDGDSYGMIEYIDGYKPAPYAPDMQYDANGNLISDADRDITVIRYNILNLPDTIQFKNGNQIVNLYDAAGRKYKSVIYTNLSTSAISYYDIAHYHLDADTIWYNITEYAGNIENHYSRTDTTRRIFNSIGYYTDSTYYHYIKDHLGNICAVVNSVADTLVQSTVYYASGVPMAENLGPNVLPSQYNVLGVQYTENFGRDEQPYLYNGKEVIEAHGLNEYDSEARMYYAPIMRTTTMDPMCESYYHISPYAWCGNNPIVKVDKDGQYYYDWDDECYRSSYGNHDEVSWSEIVWNEFIEPRPIDQVGPLRLVGEFMLGNGSQERIFCQDDNFTQQFINDNDRLEGIYDVVAEAIFVRNVESSAEDQGTYYGYNLGSKGNLKKLGIMAHDAANAVGTVFNKVSPFGLKIPTGNLAASVTGSFNVKWKLERFDSNGDAVVSFRLENKLSAGSALRPPLGGYTDMWRYNVIPKINGVFDSKYNFTGIMRTVSITMTWTTTISNPNKQ